MSHEYIPQIIMVALAGGKRVDCYFTNGTVRRYDVAKAIRLGGVFAPLKDQKLFERSVMVLDGVLAFDSKSLFRILPMVRTDNIQGEYYLTEVPELMVKNGMKVELYRIEDGNDLRGVNTPEDMVICESILKSRKPD